MHKKIFARHSEIALWIVRRHTTFVAECEANRLPAKITPSRRNARVNRRGRLPAREGDPKFVALSDGFARLLKNERRSISDEILGANDFSDSHGQRILASCIGWQRLTPNA